MRNDLNVNHNVNDDEIVEEEESSEGELDEISLESTDSRRPSLETWPTVIGIVQICIGFVTAILGALELFVVPLIQYPDKAEDLHLGKDNCYGAGLVAGFFMILTGSTAVRASISRRPTSVRKFFTLTLFTLVIYTGITVLLIVGYAKHWTRREQYKYYVIVASVLDIIYWFLPAELYSHFHVIGYYSSVRYTNFEGSLLYEVHIFVTISTLLGFMFALAAFVQYYELVFFGQYQLCRRWMACLCPCALQVMTERSDSREQIVGSNSSLPV